MSKGKPDNQKEKSIEQSDSDHRSYSGSPLTGCTGFAGEDEIESEDEEEEDSEQEFTNSVACPALLARTTVADPEDVAKDIEKLTISDYQRTRYIGASSGVHFLGDTLLHSGKKHRIPHKPSWFVQKLNDDEDEHVIMKSKEIPSPLTTSSGEFILNRMEIFEDTPHLTQDLADYLVDM
jgi:hypothetical protein